MVGGLLGGDIEVILEKAKTDCSIKTDQRTDYHLFIKEKPRLEEEMRQH